MYEGIQLMDSIVFQGILLYVVMLQYTLYKKRRRKGINNNLISVMVTQYIFFWSLSNIYEIIAGEKDGLYWILLFPQCFQQHIQFPLFTFIYVNKLYIRTSTIISIILFFIVYIAVIVLYEQDVDIYYIALFYLLFSFIPPTVGYFLLYYEFKKREIWNKYGVIIFIFFGLGLYIGVNASVMIHNVFEPTIFVLLSRLGDLWYFSSFAYFSDYIDSKNLYELNVNFIFSNPHHIDNDNDKLVGMNLILSMDEEDEQNDIIESILDQLKLSDWSVGNKLDVFPSRCSFFNKLLNLFLSLLSILLLLIHLIFYFICIIIPIFIGWIINLIFVCWIWRNEKFFNLSDYYTRFIMKEVEDLSLYEIRDRGIIWNIRYYIITFGEGLTALKLALADDGTAKLLHYRNRRNLSNIGSSNLFISADGGLLNTDYNYAIKHYSNPVQLHEFSTRYRMHSYVEKFCPIYSLGQNIGSKIHSFIREIHYNINRYLLDNFEKHQIPNDLYLPLFENLNSRGIISDDAFVYSISTFYYKCFQKRLSPQQIEIFKCGRKGLLSLGVVPPMLLNMMGYTSLPKSYWNMLTTFRELMLNEYKNHYIPRMIIETAKNKYNFRTKQEFDYAINSFCIELCPGNAGISGVLKIALDELNKNEKLIDNFKENPELFVLECLRFTGLPSSGRTVFGQIETINVDGNECIMKKGQSVVHGFDEINRCPYIFKNGDTFNPQRNNLKRDIFVFGNKEEFIRNKSALRSCPLHDYAIVQIQELIARIYALQGVVLKYGTREFRNSFQLSDDKKIHIKSTSTELAVAKKIHKSLDAYQEYILPPLYAGVSRWNENPPINIPGWEDKIDLLSDKYPIELEKDSLFNDLFYFPKWDEDLERDKFKDFILKIFALKQIFPIKDNPELFENNKQMLEWKKENVIIPKVNVVWKELISDHAMSLFAFEGLGCLYTKKVEKKETSPTRDEEESKYNDNDVIPKNAVYENDWKFLFDYEVRDGLERYGAAAYFDEDYKICGIFVSHLNKLIYPNNNDDDQLWEYSKYVWKTCVFVGITLIDHAGWVHSVESNNLVTATREELPTHHPFRRLLSIFTHRTIYINHGIKAALLSENMLIQRISGYDYDTLIKLGNVIKKSYTFKSLHERIDKSMLNVPDEVFPINHDSSELYQCMEYLIREYINVYYSDDDELLNDKYLISFYNKLTSALNVKEAFNKESFIHLISGLAVSVTGYHELVGSVMDVAASNINWIDTKMYKNKFDKLQASKNDFAVTSIVVMLTGLKVPSLMNDFSHVLIKNDGKYEMAQKVLENWQQKLQDLANEIGKRNQNRRIEFNSCNPNVLECSVSI